MLLRFYKLLNFRPVVPRCAGGTMAPPDFGRSVNPISTKGSRLCPPNNTCNPVFSDLPTVLTFTGELVGRSGLGDLDLLFFGEKFKF